MPTPVWEIQRARRLCARSWHCSSAIAAGRRSRRALRRAGSRHPNDPRGSRRKGADGAHSYRNRRDDAADPLSLARSYGRCAQEAEKPDVILTGLQSDVARLRPDGRVLSRKSRAFRTPLVDRVIENPVARRRSVRSAKLEDGWFQQRRNAAPRSADHSIRRRQTSLRHPDGSIKKAKSKKSEERQPDRPLARHR